MRPRFTLATEPATERAGLSFEHEPSRAIAFREAICGQTARLCREHHGSALQAIVLTGSLARDEATFVEEENCWRLLGDAEFLLIFRDRCVLPSKVALGVLQQSIQTSLCRLGIVGDVALSAALPDYLLRLQPHIFGYELRKCGRVVWGDSEILSRIPAFSASDIPLEDAWRLLSNRMIEQLEVLEELEQRLNILPRRLFYRTIKLYLDMATSLLLFAGQYAPTYLERAQRLRNLAGAQSCEDGFPFDLRRFSDRIAQCTRWKLLGASQDGSAPSALESSADFSFWEEAAACARLLWRWELARLSGAHGQVHNRELMQDWMKRQPPQRRWRGWVYVLRSQGWYRSWRQWPRWARLAWRASPRYWVYAAANEVFFRLPCLLAPAGQARIDVAWEAVLSRLPVARHTVAGSGAPERPRWQYVASEIVWNYRGFLEGTRA